VTCHRLLCTRSVDTAGAGRILASELVDASETATVKNPKALPGSIAATKLVPNGLRDAENAPLEFGVAMFPPKLRTVKVAGLRPVGAVMLPLTVAGGTTLKENVTGFPNRLSAAFRTWLPIVTLYAALGVRAPKGVRVTTMPVESMLKVAGKDVWAFARVTVLGPIVVGSSGSLNVTWIDGVIETLLAPFAGSVDVMVSGPSAGGGATTVNALLREITCVPVVTVTGRAPSAADGSIVTWAVALVGLVTVTVPAWPSAEPPTLIPEPKLASVCPWTKFVFAPVIATVMILPVVLLLGFMEVRVPPEPTEAPAIPIVTAFEVTPPIETTTETAFPLGAPEGTWASTTYSPTDPGARPEKITDVVTPPIVTVGVEVVRASGLVGAAAPVRGWLVTGPRPVQ
jgi:hypothetical protein